MKNERSARLRARLKEKRILMAPAAHDGLCARIYEKAGFEAIYLSGFATSSSFLGRPDVGLLDYSEMLYRASTLADVVDVPIFADGDTRQENELTGKLQNEEGRLSATLDTLLKISDYSLERGL